MHDAHVLEGGKTYLIVKTLITGSVRGQSLVDTLHLKGYRWRFYALIRKVLEETGLCVIRNSIQEYGRVHRIQKGTKYKADEGFAPEFLEPQFAIDVNRETIRDDFSIG